MAAPANKTIGDLSGKWVMNKSLSSDVDPGLKLQNMSYLTRKLITSVTLTLDIKQFSAPPSPPADADSSAPAVIHIEIDQTGTGGMKGTSEKRCLDNVFRDHKDWLFGHVKGQTRWVTSSEEVEDAFLKSGWLEGEEEKTGPNGETHVLSYVESYTDGWTATQVWGFKTIEGERRHVRNVVIAKGSERVELQLVYDYLS
ncbi:hypothetical protein GE21DRAFT_140 [Neurospora crassa]|uniref:LCCL domain-containing protein n=1 Tax=Neurospora crassa (strain ATCC 24698 / 74-OR23-1A / CBS 708.71 / DSM 1257 / FGSC 987) TaxID=367110 RepID=V5INX1_NEUCR|nr:uncharacterized protein NCU07467 [Neurospora crassa OR74A]XP_011393178.1 hypothetical protein NCU07467 [Neurospora crassa OR74A]ESA43767.1 hypothetical protein NCU07467 [Neurospora crassa OR74A]ESA43768.1 hypothetical protein, variant [Neurospora crassa OR74A]KHE79702.1 hypothetical protein GE21DRAFT_140 [Neurospora crassa]|eukprot:XP_011393177.1 uncharacterized protein NCU07467 [Neurospora crassa OR74A]